MVIVKRCIVPRCKNTSANQPHKVFLRPPRDPLILKQWRSVLKLEKDIPANPTTCCCEDHFNLPEDCENWLFYTTLGTRLALKPRVLPHRFIHTDPTEPLPTQLSESTRKRKREYLDSFARHASKESGTPALAQVEYETPSAKRQLFNAKGTDSKIVTPSGNVLASALVFKPVKPEMQDKNIQVTSSSLTMKQPSTCIMPHTCLMPYKSVVTSSPSSATSSSNTTSEAKQLHFKQNRRKPSVTLMELNSIFHLGLPKNIFYMLVKLLEHWCNITHEHVLVTLSKIRLNGTWITDVYEMSVSDVSEIYLTCLPKIADVMQNFIFWPNSIKKTLPIPFGYCEVQFIIDWLEVEMDKPQNAFRQSVTRSSEYNKCNSIKFLISCTPQVRESKRICALCIHVKRKMREFQMIGASYESNRDYLLWTDTCTGTTDYS